MSAFQAAAERVQRAKRRRRAVTALLIALVLLLGSVIYLSSLEDPTFRIQTMSVDRISVPERTVYLSVSVSVDNNNDIRAHLLGVDGEVSSGGQHLGDFESDETVEIPPNTNFTVHLTVRVTDAPLPMPDPELLVTGKARVRVFILTPTYHFQHRIPLTYDPDQENQAPSASIDAPRFTRRDRAVAFDGTSSYDPDGKVVGWTWDFSDGTIAEGALVEHAFMAPGLYDVTLTVVDQMGQRAEATHTIRVFPL